MTNFEKFIEKANKVHGDKYDYSHVEYINSTNKVKIICPVHGVFEQTPQSHLRGNGCPKCANISRSKKKITEDVIINRIKDVHGDKYDYSKVKFVNSNTKITLICPIHGEFNILPHSAIRGSGCPKCSGKGLSKDNIIDRIKSVHGDKYDYSKVEKVKFNENVCLICPKHGEFHAKLSKIIHRGAGCKKCAKEERSASLTLTENEVIDRFNAIHNFKYDYSQVKYVNMHDKVEIVCPKHGSFFQYPYDHLSGHGCPKCGNIESKAEEEIFNVIKNSLGDGVEVIRNDRIILNGKEIDILIPSKNIGIEYNGIRWHTEHSGKDKYYHLNKTLKANEKGVRLIQIFEDEFSQNKKLLFRKLLHIIGCTNNRNKIHARKCDVRVISKIESKEFLNNNHIQGNSRCSISYGCFYDGILIGVMSFLKISDGNYELVRFATHGNCVCNGVGGKLFKRFVKDNNPNEVKSFADRRWTINNEENLYTKLGFKLDNVLQPDYSYVSINNPTKRLHKFNFRKQRLNKKYGLYIKMTENEMVNKIGYTKIWNCGLLKYVWKKEDF